MLMHVTLVISLIQIILVFADLNDLSLDEISLLEEMKNYEMNLQEGKLWASLTKW